MSNEKVLEKLLLETIKEQRRGRRWGLFIKLMFLVCFIVFLAILLPVEQLVVTTDARKPHAALVDIEGVITNGGEVSADDVAQGLRSAFTDSKVMGVILRIDSPGGTPVQASYIYNEIKRLRQKYPHKKIYAVCADMCASGAYYIASATQQIYANPSSFVGSIGVLLNGFGVVEGMKKIGVERRLFTAGVNKGFLDPFSPLKDSDKVHAQTLLTAVHQQFIRDVKAGRGKRLSESPEVFSGLVWTGEGAKQLGLIDGFGSAGSVARDIFHTENIINYTVRRSYFDKFVQQFSTMMVDGFMRKLSVNAMN